jgi:hypothetical protein
MRTKRWPILDLDEGASETAIRRAYAVRLRQSGPDDDSDAFQELRAEYEDAMASLRPDIAIATGAPAKTEATLLPAIEIHSADLRARAEIASAVEGGNLLQACEIYDRARKANEISLTDQREIELLLAHCFLADTTLQPSELEEIARRYHWNDAISSFSLGAAVIHKYRFNGTAKDWPEPPKAPKPAKPQKAPKPQKPIPIFLTDAGLARKWNWGAFCLTPFWLLKNGRPLIGACYLVTALVFGAFPIVQCLFVFISVWYGFQGEKIALASCAWESAVQFRSTQNRWRNWGIPSFLVFVYVNVTLSIFGKLGPIHSTLHHVTAANP